MHRALYLQGELIKILDGDRAEGNLHETPLFNKPSKITLNESLRYLQKKLEQAGISTVGI